VHRSIRVPVSLLLLVSGFVLTSAGVALAARPAAELLPATCKFFVSVPDVDELRKKWEETQLGHLARDPVMKPFADDLRRQLREKVSRTGVRLGLTLDDLEGVYGGEVALALIQPQNDPTRHALAIVVDITGHGEAADALLAKIDTNLTGSGAKRSTDTSGGTQLRIYQVPAEEVASEGREAVFFVKDDRLVAVDDRAEAMAILGRFAGEPTDSLSSWPAFDAVMKRCGEAAGELPPHVRWYTEPFGYVQVMRAASGGRKKRGTDLLKVLKNQGFDAVEGVGGYVNLATAGQELLHRTLVYAPGAKPEDGGPSSDKYRLAARMLQFPNGSGLVADAWVPRELGTYLTLRWKMQNAFEQSKTLVDEVAGDEGFFDDLLSSIATDPNGPQIDLRKELVAYLGERMTILSDYVLPITPKSERMMFAVEVTHPEKVAETIHRAMESDPDARKLEIDGHVVWEIINQQDDEIPELTIDTPGFGPVAEEEEEEEGQRLLPNAAITVVHGQLIVATHVDFLSKIMGPEVSGERLSDSADYRLVQAQLTTLGADEDSFRFFTRTDEEYRPTYELIREGKMPEAESLLGRALNRMLGPDEEGVLRQQQIDGQQLPEYQIVRRYLGPGGLYVRSHDEGWFITGTLLTKQADYDAERDQPTVTTAAAVPPEKD